MPSTFSRRDVIAATALAGAAVALTHADNVESAQSNAIKTHKGACNCGQLTVEFTGPDPERRSLCFCKLCQKQTGSAFSIQARIPREQVKVEGKSTAWRFPIAGQPPVAYRNCMSEGGVLHFCPVCSSAVYYVLDAAPDIIGVKVGVFSDPTFPPPNIAGFEEYKFPWVMNIGAMPMPGGHHA